METLRNELQEDELAVGSNFETHHRKRTSKEPPFFKTCRSQRKSRTQAASGLNGFMTEIKNKICWIC